MCVRLHAIPVCLVSITSGSARELSWDFSFNSEVWPLFLQGFGEFANVCCFLLENTACLSARTQGREKERRVIAHCSTFMHFIVPPICL